MDKEEGKTEHYFSPRPRARDQIGLIRTHLRGRLFEFMTSSSIFSKKRVDLGTRLMVESMVLPERGCVLDMGCGYGPVGIAAAVFHPELQVIMVDVNKRALHLARENAKRNKVSNVETRHGYAYRPVGTMKFDAILSNPPVSAGKAVVSTIIDGATEHLENGGTFQLVVRSKIGGRQLVDRLEEVFGNVEVLSRKSGYRVLLSKNLKTQGS